MCSLVQMDLGSHGSREPEYLEDVGFGAMENGDPVCSGCVQDRLGPSLHVLYVFL
jgi:hypothetical protein